jgi:hypothetical protein
MSEKDFNKDSIDSVIATILANQVIEKDLADSRHKELVKLIDGHAEAIRQLQGFRYYILGGAAAVSALFTVAVAWVKEHLK